MGEQDNAQILSQQKETKYIVKITPDRLEACLSIYPKYGMPIEVSPVELKNVLHARGVTYGIKFPVLSEMSRVLSLSGESLEDIIVASGILPMDGQDATLEIVVNTIIKSIGKTKEDGTIDYKQKESILKVIKGQIIAVYHPETNGLDGMGVDWTVIKTKKGKPLKINTENVDFFDNEKVYKAREDGQLIIKKDFLCVNVVREIKGDVNLGTGCVDFPGTVIVSGSVLPEFYVKARGDVYIKEGVNDALIECDGDLNVREGIGGSYKSKVEAKGNVLAGYIQNSQVSSLESITVKKLVYSSYLIAKEKIFIEGMLIGGKVIAGREIIVKDVGSEIGADTYLEVGMELQAKKEIKEITAQIDFMNKNLEKIEMSLGPDICKLPDDIILNLYKDSADEIIRIVSLFRQIKEQKAQLEGKKKDILEKLILPYPAFIKVKGTIYPGTTICVKGRKVLIEEKLKFMKFYLNESDLTVKWTTL